MKLAVLTATFNHPNELKKLYSSLLEQDDIEFLWNIVDDGSEETTELIVKKMILENKLNISYTKKENGGKSRAITYGLDHLKKSDFVLIVDDDEYLFEDSISNVKKYYNQYLNTDVAVIHFNRIDETGAIMAKPIISEDHIMTWQERKRRGYWQDGYIGYFIDKLGDVRSPEFIGEKYVGPSVLFMTVCRKYDMLWAEKALGKTEYLDGGITKQGRKLRVNNPKGMYVHSLLMQNKDSGFFNRLVYSLLGYTYLDYANVPEETVRKEIPNYPEKLIPMVKPLRKILTAYWNFKFKKNDRI